MGEGEAKQNKHNNQLMSQSHNTGASETTGHKIIEPALQQIASETTGHTNRHLNKMDRNYNHIKNIVLETHDKAEHHINDISGKLKSNNIHIGISNI